MAFFATWMHNDGQTRNPFEQRNPVSALLSSIGKKGIGDSRLTLKSKQIQESRIQSS